MSGDASAKYGLAGVFARGIAIGLADLVPGVSGGTIALISGIYDRLIRTLNICASPSLWLLFARGKFRYAWHACDGAFLLCLGSGAILAVALAAAPLRYLLIKQAVAVLSFFCGLTITAAVRLLWQLRPVTLPSALCAAAGIACGALITLAPSATLTAAPPLQGYFLAGMLALCAMILPGISGSFVLLLLGVYPFLIDAVSELDIAVIACFAAGGLLGLGLFAKLLRRLLVRFHKPVTALLASLMIGVLPKLWPWKQSSDDIRQILQPAVNPASLPEPQLALAAACFVAGAACVMLIGRLAAGRPGAL